MYTLACPTKKELADFFHGCSCPEQITLIDLHLADCLICLGQLEQLRRTDPLLDDLRVSVVAPASEAVEDVMHRVLANTHQTTQIAHLPNTPPAIPGYEILGELGRGGMGVIYKARHLALDRIVALKLLLKFTHEDFSAASRFQVEAEALARIQHPNIVQIYEVAKGDGSPYFSMEFVDGGTLATHLLAGPMTARDAASLARTLALALAVAHRANVIHRDLKPANVLLCGDGTPKISDFGLAKRINDQSLTDTGIIMGTPAYMSPEQAGACQGEIGPASDIWALGATLYEMLTGRPPFSAPSALETLQLVLRSEPVSPSYLQPGVGVDLATICLKCLEKQPSARYSSALALADDLGRFLDNKPIFARPIGPLGRLWKWTRRQPATAALVYGGVIVAAISFGGWYKYTADLSKEKTLAEGFATQAGQRLQEANEQRELALANLRQARAAALEVFYLVRDDKELKTRANEELRVQLLRQMLQLQAKLILDNASQPELQAEHARSFHLLAQLTAATISPKEAIAPLQKAIEIVDNLLAVTPDDRALQKEWCGYQQDLLYHQQATGEKVDLAEAQQKILRRLEALAAADPTDNNLYFNLARLRINLGVAMRRSGDLAGAEKMYLAAKEAIEVCLKLGPCNDHYDTLAMCLNSLSVVYAKTKRTAAAIEAIRESIRLREGLVAAAPGYADYHRGLSASYLNLATTLGSAVQRDDEANVAYKKSIEVQTDLVKRHPQMRPQRMILASLHSYHGDFLRLRKRADAAKIAYRQSATLAKELANDNDDWQALSQWATSLRWVGLLSTDSQSEPLSEMQQVLARLEKWLTLKESRSKALPVARSLHLCMAQLLRRLGREGEAQKHENIADQLKG
jgi:serine/threonine-protein kinase